MVVAKGLLPRRLLPQSSPVDSPFLLSRLDFVVVAAVAAAADDGAAVV